MFRVRYSMNAVEVTYITSLNTEDRVQDSMNDRDYIRGWERETWKRGHEVSRRKHEDG